MLLSVVVPGEIMINKTLRSVLLALALAAPFAIGALPRLLAQPAKIDPGVYSALRWRNIGPFRGGRVNGVSGVPGQPNTFYFGSVGGGVWKTTNAGRTWLPIFDSQPIASIGAVAVAPSRPDVAYVGTGGAMLPLLIFASARAGLAFTPINYRLSAEGIKTLIARLPVRSNRNGKTPCSRQATPANIRRPPTPVAKTRCSP